MEANALVTYPGVASYLYVDSAAWDNNGTPLGVMGYAEKFSGAIARAVAFGDVTKTSAQDYEVDELGVFSPKATPVDELSVGEVGFIVANIKRVSDAKIGDMAPFRVFGEAKCKEQTVRREARYLTLYGNSHNDRMHVRPTEQARAVIANPHDCYVTTEVRELRGKLGETLQIPVKIERLASAKGSLGLVVNGASPSAGCGFGAPVTLPDGVSEYNLPLTLQEMTPGHYTVVVARSWASDLRNGRPGPCSQLIDLYISPADGK